MHDYQKFALMMTPVEEKDLILFDMSPEDKAYAVKQYNRALLNAQRDGTDVSQIILKPMIQKYPAWGDCALVYGLCLAREKEFARAENAMEYAVNNTLSSEQNLAIAQESMKLIRYLRQVRTGPLLPTAVLLQEQACRLLSWLRLQTGQMIFSSLPRRREETSS